MRGGTLVARGLRHYWRTHLAATAGVATAASVLTGALVVGDSVRGSLRDLALMRLGRVVDAVPGERFFREVVAEAPGRAPLVALQGLVTHEASGRRSVRVQVYGVDARFWAFHGVPDPAGSGAADRRAWLSEALAAELSPDPGATLLVRVPSASSIPGSSLFGRRDDLGRVLRVGFAGALPPERLGEFGLRPQQQAARAVFVPLRLLQRSLGQDAKVNTLLLAESGAGDLGWEPEDLGVGVRTVAGGRALAVESASGLVDDALAEAVRRAASEMGLHTTSYLTYLANVIRAGERTIPYSLVAAVEDHGLQALAGPGARADTIHLNSWAAQDLQVRPGDAVTLEYYLWREDGRLDTETAEFRAGSVVPLEGPAADRELTPEYPGITSSARLSDWDPPFPIDLSRIRPRDESYWETYRTAPKAFVTLARGQALWRHRLGALTSVRVGVPAGRAPDEVQAALVARLRAYLDPALRGLPRSPVRAEALAASRGATDFGEYFGYFSTFLVVSALLIAALFFRLGIEQRLREIGLLRAVGFTGARVRRLFLAEGLGLAALGGLCGVAGAVGYAALMMHGLRTWWVGAVGTRHLALHVEPGTLGAGAAAGIACAALAILLALRGQLRVSPRSLLGGGRDPVPPGRRTRAAWVAWGAALAAGALLGAAALGRLDPVAGFFGGGALLLAAALAAQWRWLADRAHVGLPVRGLAGLGLRGATQRPGRSLLCIALLAFASFMVASVGAFRRGAPDPADPRSGTGGYRLLAESVVPIHHDLGSPAGRDALGLPALPGVQVASFRRKAGDDASCLNLYRPTDPAVVGVPAAFGAEGRFTFQSGSWPLLEERRPDGRIPILVDANSMTYVLHKKVGDEVRLERPAAALVIVGALQHSLFQGELLMSEASFQRLFPAQDGYRFFLVDAPESRAAEVSAALESALADQGLDVTSTLDRLAVFHRVEDTYISTFQALGGLGLVLGTVGLATVLLRNALERRRELALLQAVGYRARHLARLVLAENALLLVSGLATGVLCALVAVVPPALSHGGRVPLGSILGVAGAAALTGLLVSGAAVGIIRRAPLLPSLRSE
jgi:putative ABC transport system permease protein